MMSYIDEFDEAEWVEIDCSEYDQIIARIGYRNDFAFDAPESERRKLSVHIGYTDPEGHRRSKTVWGNDTHGLVLWWSGYLGRYDDDGRRAPECKHWVAEHARAFAAQGIEATDA